MLPTAAVGVAPALAVAVVLSRVLSFPVLAVRAATTVTLSTSDAELIVLMPTVMSVEMEDGEGGGKGDVD